MQLAKNKLDTATVSLSTKGLRCNKGSFSAFLPYMEEHQLAVAAQYGLARLYIHICAEGCALQCYSFMHVLFGERFFSTGAVTYHDRITTKIAPYTSKTVWC